MEETISLKELFQTIKKRLGLIVLLTVLATALSGVVSYLLLTPIYQSSTQLLVNQSQNEQGTVDVNQIRSNVEIISTYNVLIKTPAILDKVSQELNGQETYSTLSSIITVAAEGNSQVLKITVQHPDPVMAASIANTTAQVFQNEVPTLMNVDNVKILSPAQVGENPSPIKPQPVLNMAIAFVVGLMAGVGLAFLLEFLDNTIKNEQDIEKLLELPVLGSITVIEDKDIQQAIRQQRQAKTRTRGETVGS
ncbi:Wzz/FepE/Etk N-terminal domain-containing protein [Sutcliffiella horikoshii]|uniref:YveK family protein n=1 Tax=Sutcliffiella horikoshii TaxID=79883 RepID=UPI00203DE114|nr:Wzz/FepE/Etk N-terminal domain-containing protein [Sutcliffiella horikoshii]MCM3617935.1 Wzz/FepE/Etk N-terminal domain-containing protein [Sutcliffiella horikoshii]